MGSLRIPTTLTLNGKELDPKIFKVEHLPDFTIPERDRQTIHVEGRSGDIVIDGGSYKNITRTYSVSFGASGSADFADKVSQISKWLDIEGYGELRDTYENEYYRLAFPSGAPKVSSILNGRMGKVQLDFSCVPKRFLMYGKDGFKWAKSMFETVEPFSKGDVDGDGRVTPTDAGLALKAAVETIELDGSTSEPHTAAWAADYDSNGRIRAEDARLIIREWAYSNGTVFFVWNPTSYDSKPVIECSGSGTPGKCYIYVAKKEVADIDKVPSVEVDLTGVELDLTNGFKFIIDCERETVYEAGTFKNLNPYTTVSNGFPIIKAEMENRVEFSGSIDKIAVFPNFWVR